MKRLTAALVVIAFGIGSAVMSTSSAHAQSVWSTLRSTDGVVILFRHALAPGGGDPSGFRLGDCSTQRNLSREGREQAREMGEQLRERGIPVDRVLASPWCRSKQTAELMDLDSVTTLRRLGSVFQANNSTAQRRERATRRLIDRQANRDDVLVIVGHQANIIDLTGIAPMSGEGVVVRADPGSGELEVLGRVPAPIVSP